MKIIVKQTRKCGNNLRKTNGIEQGYKSMATTHGEVNNTLNYLQKKIEIKIN